MRLAIRGITVLLAAAVLVSACSADDEPGFTPLFNGKDLTGWHGANYVVENGMLVCPKDGGGLLLSDQQYSNFAFRFEFKLPPGGNNGVAIRTPAEGNPADVGMEVQILDDSAPQYATLQPYQFHGSIYHLVPAKRGALKPVGEWNAEEILAQGPHMRVTVNGQVTVDAQLDKLDPALLKQYPGCLRPEGYVGFIGHGDRIEFRNIRLQELPAAAATPQGTWVPLFNGKDLTGWKGLVENPPARAKMTPEQLAAKQKVADESMRAHWSAQDGVIVFDGKGDSICTAQDYGDFELLVDWKILKGGDSGIYLRGSPQVQIWDNPLGSGGLYNNQKNPSNPLKVADKPIGEWNHFDIRMIGDQVTVYLNGELVVDHVTMENYWERDKPIYPTGQIELQNHGNSLYFKDIYLLETPKS